MASPPASAISAITSSDRLLARALYQSEIITGPTGVDDYVQWAQSHYGISTGAARLLYNYTQRISDRAVRLSNQEGAVPRRNQVRNPAIPNSYRVRVYVRIGDTDTANQRAIPVTFDLGYNPSITDIEAETRRWWGSHYRQYQASRYLNDRRGNSYQGLEVRSLECKTC